MSVARGFASDNTAPAHPAVIAALAEANVGTAPAYGDDRWTAQALAWFRGQFGDDVGVAPVWNGTGANVVALRALVRPWEAVICSEHAHINVDECGAPEFLAGCKLVDLPSPDGRLTPGQVRAAVKGIGVEHHVQPRALSLTQTTEYGTAYSVAEMTELCRVAHQVGLLVHADGARIANAAATLGVSLRALTRDAGVDILSFGATKNGGIGAEAVAVLNPSLGQELRFLRKQSAQLASKMRYLSAQFLALAEGDRWLHNARNANAMAARLADGVRDVPGVTITQRVESNAVFAVIPKDATDRLLETFHFYRWNAATGEVRWMTNWATTADDVDEFVAAIREAVHSGR